MKPGTPFNVRWLDYTQEGKLAEAGFFKETWRSSDCWACGETSHLRKPGLKHDIWRCVCGVEWETSAKGV